MPTTIDDLKKLTVPQLKSLCKEKRIAGYSKLGKKAIILKLIEHDTHIRLSPREATPLGPPPVVPPSLPVQARHIAQARPLQADKSYIESRVTITNGNPHTLLSRHNGEAPTHPSLPSTVQVIDARRAELCAAASSLPPAAVSYNMERTYSPMRNIVLGKKRTPSLSEVTSTLSKKIKPQVSLKTSSPAPRFVFKRPVNLNLPTCARLLERSNSASKFGGTTNIELRSLGSFNPVHTTKSPITSGSTAKRFIPPAIRSAIPSVHPWLLAKVPRNVVGHSVLLSREASTTGPSLQYLDFPPLPSVTLNPTSFPPSLSQRKNLPRLSVLLSGVAVEDLYSCAQVSRLFRYAVYISATHRLSKNFAGRRLEMIMKECSPNMTNMWPYLRGRENEVISRKQIYAMSFLERAFKGKLKIAKHLWTSPDNNKQITIAVRFLLTRLFFMISIGGRNGSQGIITDAQELVEAEIWSITISSMSSVEVLYVLESTCEVIGHPPVSSDSTITSGASATKASSLRADWSAYIDHRLQASPYYTTLVQHLKWTNHEEYERGISKLWLKRTYGEGEIGTAMRVIAERYILACVVSNSVSGRWMSSSEMAQEFNGLPSRASFHPVQQSRIHLFVPPHHHIESLHFTASDGHLLHPALAVVQTPGREYYILKDNGMQVGCEEEGVAAVWMQLLGCTASGRAEA